MNKEITVTLENPIIVHKGGELIEELVIFLKSPPLGSTKAKTNALKLKQAALKGLGFISRNSPDTGESEAQEEADHSKLLDAMAMAGADIVELCEIMKDLAPAVITVGDGHPFSQKNWTHDMSMEDQQKVTGLYVGNFSLASILAEASQTKK